MVDLDQDKRAYRAALDEYFERLDKFEYTIEVMRTTVSLLKEYPHDFEEWLQGRKFPDQEDMLKYFQAALEKV